MHSASAAEVSADTVSDMASLLHMFSDPQSNDDAQKFLDVCVRSTNLFLLASVSLGSERTSMFAMVSDSSHRLVNNSPYRSHTSIISFIVIATRALPISIRGFRGAPRIHGTLLHFSPFITLPSIQSCSFSSVFDFQNIRILDQKSVMNKKRVLDVFFSLQPWTE